MAVVEAALAALADMVPLAGSFLTRRFGQEAWPSLKRLLQEGPTRHHVIAPGIVV